MNSRESTGLRYNRTRMLGLWRSSEKLQRFVQANLLTNSNVSASSIAAD